MQNLPLQNLSTLNVNKFFLHKLRQYGDNYLTDAFVQTSIYYIHCKNADDG